MVMTVKAAELEVDKAVERVGESLQSAHAEIRKLKCEIAYRDGQITELRRALVSWRMSMRAIVRDTRLR